MKTYPNPSDAELLMEFRSLVAPVKALVVQQPDARPTPEQTQQVAHATQHIYDTLRRRYDTATAIGLLREVWVDKEVTK